MLHPDIPAREATSVTHYICPSGPTEGGEPVATHHLRPIKQVETCTYCGKTRKRLAAELDLPR